MHREPLLWNVIAPSVAGSFARVIDKKSPPKFGFDRVTERSARLFV